jgi:uncharacterized protein YjbI with pentapeptide repeats
VVPVSHNYKRLNQVAAEAVTSLFQQGGMVLLGFVAMLVITGGAPSGLAVGLTVGLSGLFVAWSEQQRLTSGSSCVNNRVTERIQIEVPEEMPLTAFEQEIGIACDGWSVAPSYSESDLQAWLMQLEQKALSPNKLAVLHKKFAQYSSNKVDTIEELRSLVESIEVSKADFLELARLANLNPHHDFVNTDLSGADLSEADLSGAYLIRADLSGADLSGANLSGAYLGRADLSEADLSRADLSRANLSEADLSRVDLSRAILREANLSRAILREANLHEADLWKANLRGANLSEAILSGANVEYARFSSGYGVLPELEQDLQNRGAILKIH